jgi:hypothetical protein
MLVLWAPILAIPVVIVALRPEDMPPMAWVAVIGGGAGSVAIYTLLFVLVVRAFRRDYSFLTDEDEPPTNHEDVHRGSR